MDQRVDLGGSGIRYTPQSHCSWRLQPRGSNVFTNRLDRREKVGWGGVAERLAALEEQVQNGRYSVPQLLVLIIIPVAAGFSSRLLHPCVLGSWLS